jgi:hypothetical protein
VECSTFHNKVYIDYKVLQILIFINYLGNGTIVIVSFHDKNESCNERLELYDVANSNNLTTVCGNENGKIFKSVYVTQLLSFLGQNDGLATLEV